MFTNPSPLQVLKKHDRLPWWRALSPACKEPPSTSVRSTKRSCVALDVAWTFPGKFHGFLGKNLG